MYINILQENETLKICLFDSNLIARSSEKAVFRASHETSDTQNGNVVYTASGQQTTSKRIVE